MAAKIKVEAMNEIRITRQKDGWNLSMADLNASPPTVIGRLPSLFDSFEEAVEAAKERYALD